MKKEAPQKNIESKAKLLKGVVVSTKMKDTVVVVVERFVKHPRYGKYIQRRKRYKAHDAGNTCEMGQKVMIRETKPMSKEKRFIVVK